MIFKPNKEEQTKERGDKKDSCRNFKGASYSEVKRFYTDAPTRTDRLAVSILLIFVTYIQNR